MIDHVKNKTNRRKKNINNRNPSQQSQQRINIKIERDYSSCGGRDGNERDSSSCGGRYGNERGYSSCGGRDGNKRDYSSNCTE